MNNLQSAIVGAMSFALLVIVWATFVAIAAMCVKCCSL